MQIDATSIAPDPAGTTVADAADALGITPESVRRRLRAGTLDGWQVDGAKGPEWRVTLPRAGAPVPEVVEAPTADAHAIVDALRDHVADLQGEVAAIAGRPRRCPCRRAGRAFGGCRPIGRRGPPRRGAGGVDDDGTTEA